VLHTLGEPVLATGFLGGASGEFIRRELDAAGIQHAFVSVEPPTRTCVTVLDLSKHIVTELVEETKAVDPAGYDELLDAVRAHLNRSTGLVLSGSLTPRAPQDFYARCTRLAREARVPVVLDARGEALRLALPEEPTLVKPNREELRDTVGFAVDSAEAFRRAVMQLIERGAESVVVTMGADGAVAADGTGFWRVKSPRVQAVNPIGSGDAFAAGLVAGLVRGQRLAEACKLAAACGSANALTLTSGVVRLEHVRRLIEQVIVEPA